MFSLKSNKGNRSSSPQSTRSTSSSKKSPVMPPNAHPQPVRTPSHTKPRQEPENHGPVEPHPVNGGHGPVVIPTKGYGEHGNGEHGYGENGYGKHEHGKHEHGKHEHGKHEHGKHEHGKHGHGGYGETIIIKEGKSIEEIERETRVDYTVVTTEILELLKIGETDCNGLVVVPRGEWFLEEIIAKLKIEFIEKWKIEFLFPTIKCWIEKYIIEYIEKIVKITREKIIKEFEEKIVIIIREHRCEMERREKHHKEQYCKAIKIAWEAYEKSMQKIEFVKEVRFKYDMKEEREEWAEIIKDLAPEMCDYSPRCYEPSFCIEDCRHHGREL